MHDGPRHRALGAASSRDSALIAAVLDSLAQRLEESRDPESASEAEAAPVPPHVHDMIASAAAELARITPPRRVEPGVVPVLGEGVAQEILKQQRRKAEGLEQQSLTHFDVRR
jgi:hypothetical protein